MRRALLLALAACGGDAAAPCAAIEGTCVAVRVSAPAIDAIDQLELDILYGDVHGTTATQPAGGGTVGLPLATAITLDITAPVALGVVAAGKLAGRTLGTGAASTPVMPGEHAEIAIVLAEPLACVAGSYYCGGDKVAGDPETLYQCNAGGVPLARGVCRHGCVIRPDDDDGCAGGPETCFEGGDYCGGNELVGDPRTLYRCTSGVGTNPRVCANGCVIGPAGSDDYCR